MNNLSTKQMPSVPDASSPSQCMVGVVQSLRSPSLPGWAVGRDDGMLIRKHRLGRLSDLRGSLNPAWSRGKARYQNIGPVSLELHTGSPLPTYITPGYRVVQVRLLFKVYLQDTMNPLRGKELAYVQHFSKPRPAAERDILMYQVSRQDRNGVRKGGIIQMDSIARFVQLIPKFGQKAHVSLTSDNSMDICSDYWVNSFSDKEVYPAVY